jgi:hypothetical protein
LLFFPGGTAFAAFALLVFLAAFFEDAVLQALFYAFANQLASLLFAGCFNSHYHPASPPVYNGNFQGI